MEIIWMAVYNTNHSNEYPSFNHSTYWFVLLKEKSCFSIVLGIINNQLKLQTNYILVFKSSGQEKPLLFFEVSDLFKHLRISGFYIFLKDPSSPIRNPCKMAHFLKHLGTKNQLFKLQLQLPFHFVRVVVGPVLFKWYCYNLCGCSWRKDPKMRCFDLK